MTMKDKNLTMNKTILSLFDYSGTWSQPYADAGYDVICLDKQIEGIDVSDFCVEYLAEELELPPFVHGIISSVPCTEIACSGARWFSEKDKDGRTDKAIDLVEKTLATVEYYSWDGADEETEEFGLKFWAIENPVGRMNRLVPVMENFGPWYFQPCDYGDPYTKKTGLWGEFNRNLKLNPVEPTLGSKMHKIPPGPERQNIRSKTPEGFARAFFEANR